MGVLVNCPNCGRKHWVLADEPRICGSCRTGGISKRTKTQTPTLIPPLLGTIWGIGFTFYGRRDFQSDGSYVATVWGCILFIPVVPLGSYRIIKRGTDSFSLFFIHGWSTKYTILSEAETNRGHILRMYEITFLLIFALAWLTSPKGPAPLDRVTKESIQSALSNFEGPRKGKIEGEEFRPYRDYDQNIYEKGMQLVKGEPKSLLPIWVTGEWTLRSQGGCALQCIASSFCIAFQVASVERGYWCRTFRSVKTIGTSAGREDPVSFLKKVSP